MYNQVAFGKTNFKLFEVKQILNTCLLKAGFHPRRSRIFEVLTIRMEHYNLVKNAFWSSGCNSITYDPVRTRLVKSQAEVAELNQTQSMGSGLVISSSFNFCFQIWFSPGRKWSNRWSGRNRRSFHFCLIPIPWS